MSVLPNSSADQKHARSSTAGKGSIDLIPNLFVPFSLAFGPLKSIGFQTSSNEVKKPNLAYSLDGMDWILGVRQIHVEAQRPQASRLPQVPYEEKEPGAGALGGGAECTRFLFGRFSWAPQRKLTS